MATLTLEEFIEKNVELPPATQILPKLLTVLEDPQSCIDDVIELLKLDLGLSVKILRFATSSYYGMSEHSVGLEYAIQRIGLREVNRLVSLSASSSMLDKPIKSFQIEKGVLFQDSLATAQVMHALCNLLRREQPDVFYTTGLLHGIGKIVIDQYLEGRGLTLYEDHDVVTGRIVTHSLEFERKILGFDHAQAGAALLKQWEFGPEITHSIGCQYSPSIDDLNPRLSFCLKFANTFGLLFCDSQEEWPEYEVPEELCLVTGLTEENIRESVTVAYREFQKVQEMLAAG